MRRHDVDCSSTGFGCEGSVLSQSQCQAALEHVIFRVPIAPIQPPIEPHEVKYMAKPLQSHRKHRGSTCQKLGPVEYCYLFF